MIFVYKCKDCLVVMEKNVPVEDRHMIFDCECGGYFRKVITAPRGIVIR